MGPPIPAGYTGYKGLKATTSGTPAYDGTLGPAADAVNNVGYIGGVGEGTPQAAADKAAGIDDKSNDPNNPEYWASLNARKLASQPDFADVVLRGAGKIKNTSSRRASLLTSPIDVTEELSAPSLRGFAYLKGRR